MMPRFRGMIRGFCRVVESHGFGLGAAAAVLRFRPGEGADENLADWIRREVLPQLVRRPEVVGAHFLQPSPPPPMTREQSLRGADDPMSWLVLVTAFDGAALARAAAAHLDPAVFRERGATAGTVLGEYALHHIADEEEAARVRD
jgi:hypothetical protein